MAHPEGMKTRRVPDVLPGAFTRFLELLTALHSTVVVSCPRFICGERRVPGNIHSRGVKQQESESELGVHQPQRPSFPGPMPGWVDELSLTSYKSGEKSTVRQKPGSRRDRGLRKITGEKACEFHASHFQALSSEENLCSLRE